MLRVREGNQWKVRLRHPGFSQSWRFREAFEMKFQSLGLEAAWCYVLVPWWWEEQCTTVRWNHRAGRFRCSMVQWCSFLNLFCWLVTEWAIVCKLFLLLCPSSQYTMWRQFSCPLLAPGCFGCCNGWCCLGFPLLQAGKPSAHCAGWSMLKLTWLDDIWWSY